MVRVNLHIFTVQNRDFELIPDWPGNKPIPVGYLIELDVTGKDGYGQETLGNQGVNIDFFYSNPHMVQAGGNHHPWQRRVLVKEPGYFEAWVVYDGVRSNTLQLRFVAEERRVPPGRPKPREGGGRRSAPPGVWGARPRRRVEGSSP